MPTTRADHIPYPGRRKRPRPARPFLRVSGKHYANDVPDELLDQAAGVVESEAVQNAVQYPVARICDVLRR